MKKLTGILWVAILIFLDQITKLAAVNALKDNDSIPIIKNVFQLTYLENRGAAFGILQNKIVLFVLLTSIVLIIIGFIYYRMPDEKRYKPINLILILVASGAVGNLIDRIRFNYVVDFLDFCLIDFPIFNVADCYVTISACFIFLLFFFYYKDEDINYLSDKIKGRKTTVE